MLLRHLSTHLGRLRKQSISHAQRCYHQLIDVHPEVQHSLQKQMPVVALESTIITHGMPYPQNLETAFEVEQQVRQHGALPATIAIVNGRIKVGLQDRELEELAQSKRKELFKCSRRDLPYLIAQKRSGGTTVAATMLIAHKAGIKIFATGGVGGVHRDGHVTMDVSADLLELGRTPVAVICSGVKSILDIPRTLEYLETQGVCVVTYGDANGNFPDFYTRDSNCKVAYNCETPEEAGQLIQALHDLELQTGMLIGVPVPKAYAADKKLIEEAIDAAYREALKNGIKGKDVTPFLLNAIAKITKGSSLEANMALIKNNAAVAAQIAFCLHNSKKNFHSSKSQTTCASNPRTPTIVGGSILDLSMTLLNDERLELNGATHEVAAKQSAGGVARNLAEGIYKLYGDANFITAIGTDQIGQSLLKLMPQKLQKYVQHVPDIPTSMCTVMFDKVGDCKLVLGNMEIHKTITPSILRQHSEMLKTSPLIVFDGNLIMSSMEYLLQIAVEQKRPVFFEPTDMLIAARPFSLSRSLTKQIKIISPNLFECRAIAEAITGQTLNWHVNTHMPIAELLEKCRELLSLISHNFDCVLLTLGHNGVLVSIKKQLVDGFYDAMTGDYKETNATEYVCLFYQAPKVENIVNVSGAGDSFNSGFISEMLKGSNLRNCISMGFVAAERALQANSAVPTAYFTDNQQREEALTSMLNKFQSQSV